MAAHHQIRTLTSLAGTELTRRAVNWDTCTDMGSEAEIKAQRFIRMANGDSGPFNHDSGVSFPNLPAALAH